MSKFFKFLYSLISSRLFKIILILAIILALFLSNIKKEQINVNQIEKIISKIKDNKNIDKYLKNKNKVFESETVKKEIIPEEKKNEEKKIEEEKQVEENLKIITNIFLKFKLLEDNYQERLKNNKIDRKRVAKYGDIVYYENVMEFNNNSNEENPVMHFFIQLNKGDFLSEKLVGKKVGEYNTYTQMEMVESFPGEDGKIARDEIKSKMKEAERKGVPMLSTKIINRISILDFVSEETMNNLNLEENL